MTLDIRPPSIETVRAVQEKIRAYVNVTPIHRWRGAEIDERVGADTEVVLKLELFQQTGTFKARGAINTILSLEPEQLVRGITAVSAGNHAIAAAWAAKAAGVSAKVVMVGTANPARVDRCKAMGAEVIMAGSAAEAFERVNKIAEDEGRAFIHPFEGPRVAEGTGTLGLEFIEQAGRLDALIIPVGGGGLCAGISAAVKQIQPDCRIYGVEPTGADSMHRSLAAGEPVPAGPITTIADSLAPPYSLPYSFALCRDNVDAWTLVSDDQMIEAMGLMFREMKLAVEPAGAATTAALVGPLRDELQGKRVGLIVCGANIDVEHYGRWVAAGNAMASRI